MIEKSRLSLRISKKRHDKLRRIAAQREKTVTQLIEEWVDRLKEDSIDTELKSSDATSHA